MALTPAPLPPLPEVTMVMVAYGEEEWLERAERAALASTSVDVAAQESVSRWH